MISTSVCHHRSSFAKIFGIRKLDPPGHHVTFFGVMICLTSLIRHRLVTDRWMDRRTYTGP